MMNSSSRPTGKTSGIYIYQTGTGIVVEHYGRLYSSNQWSWDALVNRKDLYHQLSEELAVLEDTPELRKDIMRPAAPIASQEIWASGVTYTRSREARMEESKDAGGGDFYAKVYEAERPEIFFKSPAYRAVGPNCEVRIRRDSNWNVPEPELTLFICSEGSIEGYTIGNDMSSRDIEGENPLYLPQAKSYDGAAAIGPCLYVPETAIDADSVIEMEIIRDGKSLFLDAIALHRMKRTHQELAAYLFKEMSFPHGAYLMTGTGIVPPDSFTLSQGDLIHITIDCIGRLSNTVS